VDKAALRRAPATKQLLPINSIRPQMHPILLSINAQTQSPFSSTMQQQPGQIPYHPPVDVSTVDEDDTVVLDMLDSVDVEMLVAEELVGVLADDVHSVLPVRKLPDFRGRYLASGWVPNLPASLLRLWLG